MVAAGSRCAAGTCWRPGASGRDIAGAVEPLEQVVGCVDFGELSPNVGPGVFVPRQRSLLLARLAVRLARAQSAPVLLETCAGVAPIASTVARAIPNANAAA